MGWAQESSWDSLSEDRRPGVGDVRETEWALSGDSTTSVAEPDCESTDEMGLVRQGERVRDILLAARSGSVSYEVCDDEIMQLKRVERGR